MKHIILLSLIPLFAVQVAAQDGFTVSGQVTDSAGRAVEFCTVAVWEPSGERLVTGAVTGGDGFFRIEKLKRGAYELRMTHIQYEAASLRVEVDGDVQLPATVLEPSVVALSEVTVRGSAVQYRHNSYTVNVASYPHVEGRDIREALIMFPGVIEHEGVLTVNGNSVSKIYINNREADASELRGLPAVQVDRVEIIPTAGAGYRSSESSGAVIKVTLKKIPEGGFYGSAGGDMTVDTKERLSDGATFLFNYRYGNLSIYSGTSFSEVQHPYYREIESRYPQSGASLRTDAKEFPDRRTFSERLSLAYDIGERQNIGASFRYAPARGKPRSRSVSSVYGADQALSHTSAYSSDGTLSRDIYQGSASYDWAGGRGATVSLRADYIRNGENVATDYLYTYLYPDSAAENRRRSDVGTASDLAMAKADATFDIGTHSKIGYGADWYLNRTSHDMQYFDGGAAGGWTVDERLTDLFKYAGDGLGAYLEYTFTQGQLTLSPSLRYQMDRIATQPFGADRTAHTYHNLFPGMNVNWFFNETKTTRINLSYLRGMNDIRYSEMNPVVRYISEYEYTRGNPDLKPAVWNIFDASALLNGKWNVAYHFSAVKDQAYNLSFFDAADPNVTFVMPVNGGEYTSHAVSLNASPQIAAWWRMNAQVWLGWHRQTYGETAVEAFRSGLDVNSSFEFGRGFGSQLTFMAEPTYKRLETRYRGVYSLSGKLYKSLLSDRLYAGLDFIALLYRSRTLDTEKFDGTFFSSEKNASPFRRLTLSLTYNFSYGKKVSVKRINSIQDVQSPNIRK
ncbi:MAG: outer membrane beta-barrel protein [Tannerella sp.]|jgi:hypothetical protein|nr:outer membrane beta-barrel protein [Tannerella sp.]